ncbi:molybdate ABC transporter substrate-binding protein [Sorangium sp. So ce1036]|uniref:molybdate ABC transporter substrate-binding protein n=1 Tax=Sorangium sp. So ce1036 TaxID=3133328 RepID=UPI003EFE4BC4
MESAARNRVRALRVATGRVRQSHLGSLAPRRRALMAGLLGLFLSSLAACEGSGAAHAAGAGAEQRLVVFAAASLRESFSHLAEELKKRRPAVAISFNFAGSQELRTQIEHGAAADVFASADLRHMAALRRAGKVGDPVIFARNEPVLVVPRGRAPAIRTLADLPRAARIVVGAPEVPIGAYASQILDRTSRKLGADFRARVEARVVSRELNVRQVLAKVVLGEADAGIVYRTDAAAARDRVEVVSLPAEVNVMAEYPMAVVTGARHRELARAWLDLVVSPAGQEILARSGLVSAAGERPGRPE